MPPRRQLSACRTFPTRNRRTPGHAPGQWPKRCVAACATGTAQDCRKGRKTVAGRTCHDHPRHRFDRLLAATVGANSAAAIARRLPTCPSPAFPAGLGGAGRHRATVPAGPAPGWNGAGAGIPVALAFATGGVAAGPAVGFGRTGSSWPGDGPGPSGGRCLPWHGRAPGSGGGAGPGHRALGPAPGWLAAVAARPARAQSPAAPGSGAAARATSPPSGLRLTWKRAPSRIGR